MAEDDKYEVLEKIGHGSFGVIRKVRRKSDGYVLCRKEISYTRMSPKEREQLQAELSILKELRHPNIVAYYEREHLKVSQDLHLYMEYCGNGDLGRVIKNLKAKNQYAEEEFVWSIFSQLVTALYRCHYGENPPEAGRNVLGLGNNAKPLKSKQAQYMILHRDLKPENVFLGMDNSVKLGDFGLSKILSSHDFASTYVGTPFYMSPEICAAERYTLYSDIWSLGCIIYELCAKDPPFNAKTHWDLIQKIKAGRVSPLPSVYSAELQKVVSSCLQVMPEKRPDTAQLLNLPIVKLMRKEQEVVQLGQQLKAEKESAARTTKEAREKLAHMDTELATMRAEIDASVRREWEVKARLEIDRQVALELEKLRKTFDIEVTKRVNEELARRQAETKPEPEHPPRSSTPTNCPDLKGASLSTLESPTDFPSATDLSTLSLDSPTGLKGHGGASKAASFEPTKRPTRTPFARAKTMFAQPITAANIASPMDVQMADPSPAPASQAISSLSLSPRRQPRKNIFAQVEYSEADIPTSPINLPSDDDEELDRLLNDEDLPALPSPTRPKSRTKSVRPSTSSSRSGSSASSETTLVHGKEDPFKMLAQTRGPLRPAQNRLASAPNLFAPNGTAGVTVKPQQSVPVVATSPGRKQKREISPVRKSVAESKDAALKSKKGNDEMRAQVLRSQLTGRTLVELAQARTGSAPANLDGDDSVKKASRDIGFATKVAEWDPEQDEMPSPFLVRTKRMIK